ncbi:unnamed protein product [Linum tenue]|uniref:Small ribosomal subunit protein mS23 n=1 Tax=Linum tenue TaxID=586396 RepID=A0AAV0IAM8_9ROSI|nr:unnamed protein product [Linum tenue]
MSFMKGDLLSRTRRLVKGMAKAEPVWLKAMEQAPPATFPLSNGKIQKINVPEDPYIKMFFRKHQALQPEDPVKFVLFFHALYSSGQVWASYKCSVLD